MKNKIVKEEKFSSEKIARMKDMKRLLDSIDKTNSEMAKFLGIEYTSPTRHSDQYMKENGI